MTCWWPDKYRNEVLGLGVGVDGRQEAGRGKKEGRRGEAEPPVPFHIHSLLAKAKGKPRKG